jgi:hypothetical protein
MLPLRACLAPSMLAEPPGGGDQGIKKTLANSAPAGSMKSALSEIATACGRTLTPAAVLSNHCRMSACGPKPTCRDDRSMTAYCTKADIGRPWPAIGIGHQHAEHYFSCSVSLIDRVIVVRRLRRCADGHDALESGELLIGE